MSSFAAAAGVTLRNPEGARLLVLLHGLGGDRTQPLRAMAGADLSEFAVIAPDLRSHGESPDASSDDELTFAAMADDVRAVVEACGQGGKPVYVAGISMGAAVALRLVLLKRLDVRGAAFIRPAFTVHPHPPNLAVLEDAGRRLAAGGVDVLDEFVASSGYARTLSQSAEGAASLRAQITGARATERWPRLVVVPTNTAYSKHELALVDVPALVVAAPRDPEHPMSIARAWASGIPEAQYVEVPSRDDDRAAYDRAIREAVAAHLSIMFSGSVS